MDRLLNNIRLRNKMFLVYLLCVFIPTILTNGIFYTIISNNVKNQKIRDIRLAIEQIKNDFRSQVDDAVSLSSFFYADYTTNEILDRDFLRTEEYVEAYDSYLRRMLNNYTPVALSLQNITVYADNATLLHSGNVGYLNNKVRETEWYKAGASDSRSLPVFIRTEERDGTFTGFSLIRKMNYYADRQFREKMVKIDFKTSTLSDIFMNLNVQGSMYLLNAEGKMEFTTDPGVDWQSGNRAYFDSLQRPNHMVVFKTMYSGVSYLEGWSVVGTINENEIVKEVGKSRKFILWTACVMMILPTVVILIITRSMNTRIIQILKHMKKVKNQNFEMVRNVEARDEIGQLTVEFNRMIHQINTLINDVYKADIQKKSLELERRKAQLNALQSQINPHFLFNALETIRMRSILKQETETAKIIHNMGKIFRSSLTWNKDRVTVKEELEFILCFLEIQKYRFGSKLEYHIDVSPESYACTVPKMLFLPFVENASIHGIEPLKNGGAIHICILTEEGNLVFSVQDNGIGMEKEKVDRLYSYLNMDEIMGDRIGVQNVLYRAQMIYGDRFEFRVESSPGEGTVIRLRIPIMEQDV